MNVLNAILYAGINTYLPGEHVLTVEKNRLLPWPIVKCLFRMKSVLVVHSPNMVNILDGLRDLMAQTTVKPAQTKRKKVL